MVMHFTLGVLGIIWGFKAPPAAAFFISGVSLLLDFDSACSIVDASINGTTMWKDPKYGNWHSVSRCDDWFLGHAMLTHTVLFAIIASALACWPVMQLLRSVRQLDYPLSHCFKMTVAAMGLHLVLDLCTFAKDCSEHEHLYLWPVSQQSYHLNCLLHTAFGFSPVTGRMRALRLLTEIGVHCLCWYYIFMPLRKVNPALSKHLAMAALPGYLLEEIGPLLLSVPNGWGNTTFLLYLVGFTCWIMKLPEDTYKEHGEDASAGDVELNSLKAESIECAPPPMLAACVPWVSSIYHEVSAPGVHVWVGLLAGCACLGIGSMAVEQRCQTFACSICSMCFSFAGTQVCISWVLLGHLEAHGPKKIIGVLGATVLALSSINALLVWPMGSGTTLTFVFVLVYLVFFAFYHKAVGVVSRSWNSFSAPTEQSETAWRLPEPARCPMFIVVCLIVLVALQFRLIWIEMICYRPSAKSNAVYPVMARAERLLAEVGIDYWIEGGAVLGLLREAKLHRWDIDVDYAVDSTRFSALHTVAKNETLLSAFGLAYKPINIKDWHAPDMEEFVLYRKGGEVLGKSPTGYVHLQSCRHFRPGAPCELNRIKTRCPASKDVSLMFASDYQALCDPDTSDKLKDLSQKAIDSGRLDAESLTGVSSVVETAARIVHSPRASLQYEMETFFQGMLNIPGWCAAQNAPSFDLVPECSRFEALMLGDDSAYLSGWKGCTDEMRQKVANPLPPWWAGLKFTGGR